MSLGEKISTLRKSKGLSQEMLAEQSKLSLRTIQRIESGATVPRPYTLGVIAVSLNVSPDDLSVISDSVSVDDVQPLRLINLTSILVFVIPVIHMLVMLVVWRKLNLHHPVNPYAKRIISFQIIWTIVTPALAFSAHFIQRATIHSVAIGQLPPTILLVFAIMLFINLFFIMRAALQLQRNETAIYSFIPALF